MAKKKIIFCSDGVWDQDTSNTNVSRMFKSLASSPTQVNYHSRSLLAPTASSGQAQVAQQRAPRDVVRAPSYQISRRELVKSVIAAAVVGWPQGGAFGVGLFQQIKDCYQKIAMVYEKGDEIFLFGFSQGAYTARSAAGMIAICGLPTKNYDSNLVATAFQAYRNKDQRALLLESLRSYEMMDAKITMLGVWDTVGPLGIPEIFGGVAPTLYGFLDTSLHPNILNAYHAIAIDEKRLEFPPTLWTSQPVLGQVIEQVWFTGVHSDVGGGYVEQELSDITLGWMLKKATRLGVEVSMTAPRVDAKSALAVMHESWSPIYGFPKTRLIPKDTMIANSVAVRLARDPSYRPANLDLNSARQPAGYSVEPVIML